MIYTAAFDGVFKYRDSADVSWIFDVEFPFEIPPVIGNDNTIYIGGYSLYALDTAGNTKWHFPIPYDGCVASPAVVGPGGTIYFLADADSGVCAWALNPDGSLKWKSQDYGDVAVSCPAMSPAIAQDGTFYFAGDDGLYALGEGGALKWHAVSQTEGGCTSPAIGPDGTVYFSALGNDGDDYLFAVQGVSPLANSDWPMFQHDPQHTGRAGH
jgi:outer membrane protein assembly factor BamB